MYKFIKSVFFWNSSFHSIYPPLDAHAQIRTNGKINSLYSPKWRLSITLCTVNWKFKISNENEMGMFFSMNFLLRNNKSDYIFLHIVSFTLAILIMFESCFPSFYIEKKEHQVSVTNVTSIIKIIGLNQN